MDGIAKKGKFKEGQLVLAKVGKFPWWPAMIKRDPIDRLFSINKGTEWIYHVGFVGDGVGKRAWLGKDRIINILTIEEFRNRPGVEKEPKVRPEDKYRWKVGMTVAKKLEEREKKDRLYNLDILNKQIKKKEEMRRKKQTTIKTKKQPTKKVPLKKRVKKYAPASSAKRFKVDPVVTKTSRQIEMEETKEKEKKKKAEAGPAWVYEAYWSPAVEAPEEDVEPYILKNGICCKKCWEVSEKEDMLKCCKAKCGATYHKKCVENIEEEEGKWTCSECLNSKHVCFICKSADLGTDSISENKKSTKRCISSGCKKWYHEECLTGPMGTALWPQTDASGCGLICPAHICHTCATENIKYGEHPVMKYTDKLLTCIKCPTSYHNNDYCVAAGTKSVSEKEYLCPKHYIPPKPSKKKGGKFFANMNFCVQMCSTGGEVLCCDLCATSIHQSCAKNKTDGDNYYCEDCESGWKPLYGEIVWAKYGKSRWWPVEVLPWEKVPDNIEAMNHQDGQFPVRFLGEDKYHWISQAQVFKYNKGDDKIVPTNITAKDVKYKRALIEGEELNKKYIEAKEVREAANKDEVSKKQQKGSYNPKDYIKIRKNKLYGGCKQVNFDVTECTCKPDDDDPCGETSDCPNRWNNEECSPKHCPAGERCGNQRMQRRQYASCQVIRTNDRDSGLRAKQDIKKGDLIVEYVGEVITNEELMIRKQEDAEKGQAKYYYISLDSRRMIDAGRKGNEARFANHSCDPNANSIKWEIQGGDTRIGLYAVKDIPAEEEITFGYSLSAWVEDEEQMLKCLCGASICSGFIGKPPMRKEPIDQEKQKGDKKKNKAKKLVVKKPKTNKRKRSAVIQEEKFWEYYCHRCDEPGHFDVKCEDGACPKVYHLKCARLESLPGSWSCPWHSCDVCKKRVDDRCRECPTAYCDQHKEGKLMPIIKIFPEMEGTKMSNKKLGNLCNEHQGEIERIRESIVKNTGKLPTPHPTQNEINLYKKANAEHKNQPFHEESPEEDKENEESMEEIPSLADNSKKSQGNHDNSASGRQSLSTVRL